MLKGLISIGAEYGISVEIDTSDRTLPGEQRTGVDPLEGIGLFLAGLAGREALRFADSVFDECISWVGRRRKKSNLEPFIVALYGPDGNVLKQVKITGKSRPSE